MTIAPAADEGEIVRGLCGAGVSRWWKAERPADAAVVTEVPVEESLGTIFWGKVAALKIGVYLRAAISQYVPFPVGPVAQLIERVVRNDEVVGLIPIRSTSLRSTASG